MNSKKGCSLLSLICFATLYSTTFGNKEQEFMTNYLKTLYEMDGNIAPEGIEGPDSPVVVKVSMYISDIGQLDDKNMDYDVWYYFRQTWNDTRLKFDESVMKEMHLKVTYSLWVPDTFLPGARDDRALSNVVRIRHNGEVFLSTKMLARMSCPMDLKRFPHDYQICNIKIESYAFARDKIEMEWVDDTPLEVSEDIKLPDFELVDANQDYEYDVTPVGAFKCLVVKLKFQRVIGSYLTKLYIPLIILVLLANLSFWISPKNHSRLILLLIILYLMISIVYSTNTTQSSSTYIKAIDIWTSICQIFIFAAVIEFYAVYSAKDKKSEHSGNNLASVSDSEMKEQASGNNTSKSPFSRLMAVFDSNHKKENHEVHPYDAVTQVLFPLFFLIFNVVYWSVIYAA